MSPSEGEGGGASCIQQGSCRQHFYHYQPTNAPPLPTMPSLLPLTFPSCCPSPPPRSLASLSRQGRDSGEPWRGSPLPLPCTVTSPSTCSLTNSTFSVV